MSGKNVNANLTKTSSRSHLLSGAFLCLTVLIQLPFWGAGQAIARDRDTAYRTEESSAPWSVDSPVAPSRQSRPGIHEAQLNQQEADRYRRIFELQDATDWRAADKLIADVTDMRLMGHVEYQRLMHPSHKATYSELRGWLERYADHAGADKVYQLALKRMARGDRKPPAPSRDGNAVPTGPNGAFDSVRGLAAAATVSTPRGRSVRTQAATKVELASTDDESSSILPPSAVTIPTSAAIAVAPAPRREPEPPSATRSGNWNVGIAAWKAGQNDKAAKAFQALAQTKSASPWDQAAGAYWAARSHQRARRSGEATKWLELAAQHTRTFYGLIARQALGKGGENDLRAPVLTRRHVRTAGGNPVRPPRHRPAPGRPARHRRAGASPDRPARRRHAGAGRHRPGRHRQDAGARHAAGQRPDRVRRRSLRLGAVPAAAVGAERRLHGGPGAAVRADAAGKPVRPDRPQRRRRPWPDAAHAGDRDLCRRQADDRIWAASPTCTSRKPT